MVILIIQQASGNCNLVKEFSFIFAGTSTYALDCLKLLMTLKSLRLKGIVTRPDSSKGRGMKSCSSVVKSFAQNQGLPYWTPKKADESKFLNKILQKKCDFSFVCAYGQILPLTYLQLFPKGCVNLHLSLLPRWRGAAPVQRALLAGDKKTGVCLQVMTKDLDAGDIIGQKDFKIEEKDNAKDIFDKALIKTKSLLEKDLIKFLKGEVETQAQNHSEKTYAQKINKKEGEIVWKESALNIHNKIRALFLGPQAFSLLKGKRIKIYQSEPVKDNFPDFLPGEICAVQKDQLIVACSKGVLSLLEVQKEGKTRQKIKNFLTGNPIKIKDCFGQ